MLCTEVSRKPHLFIPCDGFVHCCPLLKPPGKYLETTRINYFNKERIL